MFGVNSVGIMSIRTRYARMKRDSGAPIHLICVFWVLNQYQAFIHPRTTFAFWNPVRTQVCQMTKLLFLPLSFYWVPDSFLSVRTIRCWANNFPSVRITWLPLIRLALRAYEMDHISQRSSPSFSLQNCCHAFLSVHIWTWTTLWSATTVWNSVNSWDAREKKRRSCHQAYHETWTQLVIFSEHNRGITRTISW